MRSAKTELGKTVFGNIIALGAIAAITKIISPADLERSVLGNVPQRFKEDNKKALEIGLRLGKI
jgi:2-oxoglutarate ferredoxin oxidoreductase subunit gamma